MLSGVKCTVRDCHYNEEGNNCSASAIEVNVDGGGHKAGDSEKTNCQTYVNKE